MAYLLPMALMSVVSGAFTDKVNRVHLLTGACFLWSLTSIIGGSFSDFGLFVLMRVCFGILTSALNPASLSLIRDYFPENKRSQANAWFNSATYIGGAVASFSQYIIRDHGWRADYLSAGLFGSLAGLIGLAAIKQPVRRSELE
jgi:ACS family D-galactonate transporter-like MFS transporter